MLKIEDYPEIYKWQQQALELVSNADDGELPFWERACMRVQLKRSLESTYWLRLSALGCIVLDNILDDWIRLRQLRTAVPLRSDLIAILRELVDAETLSNNNYGLVTQSDYDNTAVTMIRVYEYCSLNQVMDNKGCCAPEATLSLIDEVRKAHCLKNELWEDACRGKWDNKLISPSDCDVHGWASFNLDPRGNSIPEDENERLVFADKKRAFWTNWLSIHLKQVIESGTSQLKNICRVTFDKHSNSFANLAEE